MAGLVFSHNGWIVHRPNPEADPDYENREAGNFDKAEFAGRQPILVDPEGRHIYVGDKNWYHYTTALHHGLHDDDNYNLPQGYFGGGGRWGGGKLQWYGHPDKHDTLHQDVAQALLEAGYNIPNAQPEEKEEQEDPFDVDWDDVDE